jgi:hypothetical protein
MKMLDSRTLYSKYCFEYSFNIKTINVSYYIEYIKTINVSLYILSPCSQGDDRVVDVIETQMD